MMFLFVLAAILAMMSVVGVYIFGAVALVFIFIIINNYIDGVYDEDKDENEDEDEQIDENNEEDF